MTWTTYPIERFAEFSGQWDKLARSRPGTPFLEAAFLQPAIDIFGNNALRLCLKLHNDVLCAATIVQPTGKGMWQTFQPSQLPLGAWISDQTVNLVKACNELMRELPGLPLGIGVTQLDPRVQARPDEGAKTRTEDYIQTAWVNIDSGFETFWEARGKNLKQNTRKQRNKLASDAIQIKIDCVTDKKDVAEAMVHYGQLESAGWKTGEGTAIHPDNAQGKFYRIMLENYCELERARIYRYWFDDKVVAMDLCIHDDSAIVVLKTTYDESYKSVSPSTLMRQDEFNLLFNEKKFERIEFFGAVMEWHTRWTTENRNVFHVTEYRLPLLRRLQETLA